jgi:hypothetical protein
MPLVHYYLGRPAHVWVTAMSRPGFARRAPNGTGLVRVGIPARPTDGEASALRDSDATKSTMTAGAHADARERGGRLAKDGAALVLRPEIAVPRRQPVHPRLD